MLTAFEDTAQKYRRRVYSFARYFLSNREEAEDVTQEVLLRLWRHQDGVDEERLGAWLLRVTRNACYDLLRKRRSDATLAPGASLDEDEAREIESAEPDPQARAEAADFRRRLLEALSELGEPYKSIVILREVQGLPHREIGEALGMPEVTVRVHLHRGRKKLRERLLRERLREVSRS
ncbi:MAG TPA: sigma-70 family RNA polymerase sigma factor [Thermoanaerobaculia bacterium]|jgi:RNA polymerase sigma-70 factor (ECF subfamily)|nr:sigma-70 family RNA polymerase sigma factor [Thermoanaerobaculia bacterium]